MKIGIQLPEVEREVRWPEYLAMAKAAEEVGFESVWLGDHLLYDGPERAPWEAWTLLSALAAATRTVRLGPLVACAGFHPPAVLAKMASTIDEVSGGRFVLGLGSGWNRREFDAFGIPYDKRVSRFEEAFAIISGLLRGRAGDARRHLPHGRRRRPAARARAPDADHDRLQRQADARRSPSPTSQAWNTWWDDYHNAPEGLAKLIERDRHPARDHAQRLHARPARRDAGRARARTACTPSSSRASPSTSRELGEAGADEVIVVASPITERSIRTLGELLPR